MNLDHGASLQEKNVLTSAVLVTPKQAEEKPGDSPLWSVPLLWCGIALPAVVGCLGFYRELVALWSFWTGDPMRSIGILIPPVSILLTLRVWKQNGWERRGSWWGLALIGLAYAISLLRKEVVATGHLGRATVSLLPVSSPLYFYGAGILVLFAGWRVWRRACFPLLLMLLAQPLPGLTLNTVPFDIPLQKASAHIARSFATLIGSAQTTSELRLMFAPDFGMFIAPGCDGMRGAVTMGYLALILGYLKRVSLPRWILYVSGAVLLGYLFNFVRLCLLVIYYRIALGHPWLEHVAKQADYVIGSCLFVIATLLFLWAARRRRSESAAAVSEVASMSNLTSTWSLHWKGTAFAVLVALAVSLQAQDLKSYWENGDRPRQASDLMPKQIGDFKLSRTWYEQSGGIPVMEDAAYSAPGSGEVMMGVWVAPMTFLHNSQDCRLMRGLDAQERSVKVFTTAHDRAVPFDSGFYYDGVIDSIFATALCSPSSCIQYPNSPDKHFIGMQFTRMATMKAVIGKEHPVSFTVRIDIPHTETPKSVMYQGLTAELQRFVAGLDLAQLSRTFQ
jgi:exosortase J